MAVTQLQIPSPAAAPRAEAPRADAAPVALLHLPLEADTDLQSAASTIYRETRQGRRVVAVAGGGSARADALAAVCDALGLEVSRSQPKGSALVHEPVVIVEGTAGHLPSQDRPARRLRIALAGCGVVGGGLLERIEHDRRVELVGVLVRDPSRPRDPAPARHLLVTDPAALLAREPDVVIDCLSDASTGLALTRAALSRGVHVVSAAKQAVGADLKGLQALADAHNATLAYSAAVGGGTPMIETLARALAHGQVARIEAVLNGTVNFLLNRLGNGQTFEAALADARALGFAEEDPSSDLEGRDAAAKLAILATLAFGKPPSISNVSELSAATELAGSATRQIARADAGSASVTFEDAGADPLFARLPDEWNALRVTCADGRTFTCRGRGAGRAPTAESVWADVVDLLGD